MNKTHWGAAVGAELLDRQNGEEQRRAEVASSREALIQAARTAGPGFVAAVGAHVQEAVGAFSEVAPCRLRAFVDRAGAAIVRTDGGTYLEFRPVLEGNCEPGVTVRLSDHGRGFFEPFNFSLSDQGELRLNVSGELLDSESVVRRWLTPFLHSQSTIRS